MSLFPCSMPGALCARAAEDIHPCWCPANTNQEYEIQAATTCTARTAREAIPSTGPTLAHWPLTHGIGDAHRSLPLDPTPGHASIRREAAPRPTAAIVLVERDLLEKRDPGRGEDGVMALVAGEPALRGRA